MSDQAPNTAPLTPDEIGQVRALLERGVADAISPNYVTVDAAGKVTAVFPGGVQLEAGPTTGSVEPSSALRWLNNASAIVAQIEGLGLIDPSDPQLNLTAAATPDASPGAQATIGLAASTQDTNAPLAQLLIVAGSGTSEATLAMRTADGNPYVGAVLFDAQGRSDFCQAGRDQYGTQRAVMIHGPYWADGVSVPANGGETTVSIVVAGWATWTAGLGWDQIFPVVALRGISGGRDFCTAVYQRSGGTATVYVRNEHPTAAATVDVGLSFITFNPVS